MVSLFVYGTLQEEDVQKKVIGRTVSASPGKLNGFKKSTVVISGNTYPILVKDAEASIIEGYILDIDEHDFSKLDEYETDAYQRSLVTLENGTEAWVYHQ